MIHAEYFRLGPVPALAFWFVDSSKRKGTIGGSSASIGEFLVARFAGKACWILADPERDSFLSLDLEIVVDADRGSGKISIGRTPAVSPAYLSEFPTETGFTWDGWFLLAGPHEPAMLPTITEQWLVSQDSLHETNGAKQNNVPAEAFYTYSDAMGLVWVPSVPLDEAVRLIYPQGDVIESDGPHSMS